MQIPKRDRYLCCIKACMIFGKSLGFHQVLQQFSTSIKILLYYLPNIIHDEIYASLFDKNPFHRYQEGMIHLEKDTLFHVNVFYRVQFDYHIFSDALHGIKFLSFLILY